jgi:hypothetical protein
MSLTFIGEQHKMSLYLGNTPIAHSQDISGKANLNLDNSTAITNCITSIPQDIKLELNNGTLTLKAGSKVYMPNGAGVFNIITMNVDAILIQLWGANNQVFVVDKSTIEGGTVEEIRNKLSAFVKDKYILCKY